MKINNNSDLTFSVILRIGDKECCKTLNARVRTTAEEIFAASHSNVDIPRYFSLKVLQNGHLILERPWIEKNTYVGCIETRGGLQAHVSFEKDSSVEATQPTEEMVRIIADQFKARSHYWNCEGLKRDPSSSDEDYLHQLWAWWTCAQSTDDILRAVMRPEQAKAAIREIFL